MCVGRICGMQRFVEARMSLSRSRQNQPGKIMSEPITHPLYQFAWDDLFTPKAPPSNPTLPTESSSPEARLPDARKRISFPKILLDL